MKFAVKEAAVNDTLQQALEFIDERLAAVKHDKRKAVQARLMSEEALVSLMEHGDFSGAKFVNVTVRKFFGETTIKLEVPGEKFAFMDGISATVSIDVDDMSLDTAEAVRGIVLNAFAENITYNHKRGINTVKITAARSSYTSLYITLGALTLAVITGLLAKMLMPGELCTAFQKIVLTPTSSIFMNALKMCTAPVVFLSIASCTSQLGNFSEIQRVGSKLVSLFVITQIIAAVIGVAFVYVFQPGSGIAPVMEEGQAARGVSVPFMYMLENLVPANFFAPFMKSDVLQLMILGIFTGTAARVVEAKIVCDILDEFRRIFMRITKAVVKFIPVMVFCSITSMVLTSGFDTIVSLAGIMFVLLGAFAAIIVIYALIVTLYGLNPAGMFKKSLPSMITAFTTSSSLAALPDAMNDAENMGISPKVSSFAIPLGVMLNKNASCLYFVAGSLILCGIYGVKPDVITLCVSTLIIVMGMPGMPGAGIIGLTILLQQAECPAEAVGIVMGIEPLIDMARTATNLLGNFFSALVAAKSEGLLDLANYNRP